MSRVPTPIETIDPTWHVEYSDGRIVLHVFFELNGLDYRHDIKVTPSTNLTLITELTTAGVLDLKQRKNLP